MVSVTVSPSAASPSTLPVIVTVPLASIALSTSSPAIVSMLIEALACVSKVTSSGVEVAVLPALSVTLTVRVLAPSANCPLVAVKLQLPSAACTALPNFVVPLNTSTRVTSLSMLERVNVAVVSFVRLSTVESPVSLEEVNSITGTFIKVSIFALSAPAEDVLPY